MEVRLSRGMRLTFMAFEVYEIIARTDEKVEDPKKNVPRAVFLSPLVVVPISILVAGPLALGPGLVAGWVARQVVVRVLRWLRLDRLGARTGWRAAFEKGDVRAALDDGLGAVTAVLVFLVIPHDALQLRGLTALAHELDSLVEHLANTGLVVFIAGVGGATASSRCS
jgi:hypothetical protein